jgi:hypothetical protein
MKVNTICSLDLEVAQALEDAKNKNRKFSRSNIVNSYLRKFFGLDKETDE